MPAKSKFLSYETYRVHKRKYGITSSYDGSNLKNNEISTHQYFNCMVSLFYFKDPQDFNFIEQTVS